jgi:hypothetical protein
MLKGKLTIAILGWACLLSGCQPAAEVAVAPARTLLEKDFKSDLPAGKTWLPAKANHLELTIGKKSPTKATFDFETIEDDQHTGRFLKTLKVSQSADRSSDASVVTLGNPVNLGTKDKVLMSIPLTYSWSSTSASGKQLFAEQMTISADGSVK